ncbi:DUF397 domain-containing protein [Plantactinospora sp. CA-294935]|uniref:DUF397 domain-containing protein n=1 Tax=Plantactinospora sp. CA-294935 TaxID=3240012 RepID=UPI003D90959B
MNTTLDWRKSSHSDTGSCVEAADNLPGRVLVRDSKDRDGGTLVSGTSGWHAFLDLAKRTGRAG